jgi:hypothetical protein
VSHLHLHLHGRGLTFTYTAPQPITRNMGRLVAVVRTVVLCS